MLISPLYILFCKISVQIFCLFFLTFVFLVSYIFMNSRYSPLSDIDYTHTHTHDTKVGLYSHRYLNLCSFSHICSLFFRLLAFNTLFSCSLILPSLSFWTIWFFKFYLLYLSGLGFLFSFFNSFQLSVKISYLLNKTVFNSLYIYSFNY